MSELNKDNWLQKLFIDQAKPALDRHGSGGGGGEANLKEITITKNGVYEPVSGLELGGTYTFKENLEDIDFEEMFNKGIIDAEYGDISYFINDNNGLTDRLFVTIYVYDDEHHYVLEVFKPNGDTYVYYKADTAELEGFDKFGWHISSDLVEPPIFTIPVSAPEDGQMVEDINVLAPFFGVILTDGFSKVSVNVESGGESVKYSEGLEFEEYSSGSYYAVVGIGTCTDTELTIPPFYNGRLVGAINYGAIMDGADFTSLVIPDTILVIEGDSFWNCENLTSVVMGSSVADIQETVFSDCTNLKRVDFSRHSFVPKVSEDWPFEFNHEDLQIKVPADLYDEWIAATNWCDYADYIVTEFTN